MISLDKEQAVNRLKYLALATQKFGERELARKKLASELKRLKKISTVPMKQQLTMLEKRIAETIEKERSIIKRQSDEERVHHALKEKIARLEGKIGVFLEKRTARLESMRQLEEKLEKKFVDSEYGAGAIGDKIKLLEKMLSSARKSRKFPKSYVARLAARLKSVKEKSKKL